MESGGFDSEGCLRDRYTLRRLLGSGSSGEVMEGWDTYTNKVVAIKKLTGPLQPRRVLREIHILTKLDNPHIIQLIDVRQSTHKKGAARGKDYPAPRSSKQEGELGDNKGKKRDRDGNTVRFGENSSQETITTIFIVMEFLDTDLRKLINSPQYLTIEHIQTIMRQMLQGLMYMHRCV